MVSSMKTTPTMDETVSAEFMNMLRLVESAGGENRGKMPASSVKRPSAFVTLIRKQFYPQGSSGTKLSVGNSWTQCRTRGAGKAASKSEA